jgi:sRNA-binding protein
VYGNHHISPMQNSTKDHSILPLLQARFPVAFGKPCRPLAIGIKQEIRAVIPAEEVPGTKLNQALAFHCGRLAYLKAVLADDARRIHLDGSDAGEVAEDAKRFARERLEVIEARLKAARPAKPVAKKPAPRKEKPVKKLASAEKLAQLQNQFGGIVKN